MIRYEFGVGTNKWKLYADDDVTAYISMSVFIAKNIPIAVYYPKKYAFMPEKILEDNIDNYDGDKVNLCINTIKKLGGD